MVEKKNLTHHWTGWTGPRAAQPPFSNALARPVSSTVSVFESTKMKNTMIVEKVRACIESLSRKFYENSNAYFSESDLQSYLFALLLAKFDEECELETYVWGTDKPKKVRTIITRKLHSELLLPEGRIDLAILDLGKVNFAVNSKGRNPGIRVSEGNHVFIEIKASRTSRSSITSKRRWEKLILSDVEKLNKYNNKCFMLCFDFENILDDNDLAAIRNIANENIELHHIRSCYDNNYFGIPIS